MKQKHLNQNINPQKKGTLYIVATPIGNLKDISLRALEILEKSVDLIAAEDTRHSRQLLQHYAINTRLISLHEYNEKKRSEILIDYLLQGKNIALISDAGTPLVSDPGYRLVKLAREQQITVIPIPGACAAIAALSASGLPTDRFVFEGFLPVKTQALRERLQELASETRTTIFYVAPHRLLMLIEIMIEILGTERNVVLAKELTKMFETVYSANLSDLHNWLVTNNAHQKGEFVLLLQGQEKIEQEIDENTKRILQILSQQLPPKLAAKLTAEITSTDKKKLYDLIIHNTTKSNIQ